MQVKWKKRAEIELARNIDFVLEHFGKRVARAFYNSVKRYNNYFASNPYMGPREELLLGREIEYHSFVVHKHFKIVYYVDEREKCVYIVDMWDVRREPKILSESI